MNQWNAPSAYAATKKDTLPAAPAAQADDPFANFMNMQSSQNAAPQAPQQRSNIPAPVAAPQEIQQRNDIPAPVPAPQETQQRSAIPIDAAYQAPVDQAYPSMQQAYFRDHLRKWSPEDDGMFPENP
ncbi:uncharacterized protein LOC110245147 [Exaiptasia diaphana]|uniref:Uncharacterized protein n=1 Tax=Exaiptasia diaphana TaxID=2652724 RepID=A0A913XN73_EXADI|nr:uncharacterized protein LOC110245147 [Exaiptasia diaphana]